MDGHCLFAVSSGEEKQIRRHLAEVVGMLGPPPRDLVQRIRKRRDLFLEDGKSCLPARVCVVYFADGAVK